MSVVRHVGDRVAVTYLGRLVEVGTRADLFEDPQHPYSQALLSAVPVPDPVVERRRERIVLSGTVPSPVDPPSGCRFRTRCWKAADVCVTVAPPLEPMGSDARRRLPLPRAARRRVRRRRTAIEPVPDGSPPTPDLGGTGTTFELGAAIAVEIAAGA